MNEITQGLIVGIYEVMRGYQPTKYTFFQSHASEGEKFWATQMQVTAFNNNIAAAIDLEYGADAVLIRDNPRLDEIYEFPLFKLESIMGAVELTSRIPNIPPYQPQTREQSEQYWGARKFMIMMMSMMQAKELMMSQLLLTGTVKLNTAGKSLDFKRDPKNSIKTTTPWTDKDNAQPFADLAKLAVQINMSSSVRPRKIVMNGETWEVLRATKQFNDEAKNIFTTTRASDNPLEERGASLAGTLVIAGYSLEVWVYDARIKSIKDNADVEVVPFGNVIMCSYNLSDDKIKWYYGATDAYAYFQDLLQQTGIGAENFEGLSADRVSLYGWTDGTGLRLGVQMATMPIPADINTTGVLNVIA